MRFLLSALVVLAAGQLLAATKYVDFAGGSDANNGNSTATPYKRAPGMVGVAHAYVPAAGDIIILKGGTTWTNCFRWNISAGGTAGNPVVYKSDPAWFSGGAFTKPLLDYQHLIIASGGYTDGAGTYVTASDVTFDGLEWANYRCSRQSPTLSNWGAMSVTCNNVDNVVLSNCTIRDWDVTAGTLSPGYVWDGGGGFQKVNGGSGIMATNCLFHLDNTPAMKAGAALWNVVSVLDCTFRGVPTAVMYANTASGNTIDGMPDSTDPAQHGNAFLMVGPVSIYNNIGHDISAKATVIFIDAGYYGGPASAYVYNNVFWNTGQPCVAIDTDRAGWVSEASYLNSTNYVYNNTLVGPGGAGYCVRGVYRSLTPEPIPNLFMRNNHLISSDPVGLNNTAAGNANVTVYTHGNNLTNTLAAANSLGYTVGNSFAPLDATKPTFNTGTAIALVTTDRLGTARPQAAVYDIGAYEFVTSSGVPGTIVLATSADTVTETALSITITASRTGGTSGAVGISYGTASGTATPGVNYTTTMGTLSWINGDAADKTFAVPILNVPFYGSKQFTVTLATPTGGATLGAPSTETVTINGVGSAPINLLSGLSWPTPSDLASPFTSSGAYYSQAIQTTDPASAGIANYYFTNTAGTYAVYANTLSPSDAENSLYFAALGTTPVEGNNVFDITSSAVTNEVAIRQRGPTGTPDFAETNAVQLTLAAGVTNQIQLRGREPNVRVYNVRIVLVSPPPDPPTILSTVITNIDGYYKATSNLVASILWSTNVTVTGTPQLTNNAGGLFTYASGSGTDTLLFTWTIAAGQNSQSLDYVDTTSLALNGGTIKNAAIAANTTLPTVGAPGSLAYGRSVVVDTTAPTITIGPPSATLAAAGSTVFYAITWSDLNFAANTLTNADITLNGTTTGTVSTGPSNPGPVTSVTLSALTVGTGTISITSGTASDLAGNLAPSAGPSYPFSISSAFGGTANVISTRTGIIIINP